MWLIKLNFFSVNLTKFEFVYGNCQTSINRLSHKMFKLPNCSDRLLHP